MRAARGVIVALLFCCCTSAGQNFSADVNLVVLDVAVLDRNGFVGGLERENFELLENGRRQRITVFQREDSLVTAGLVLDASSSMIPRRRETIAAAISFLEASNPADEAFILFFNESVSWGLPVEKPFSNERAVLIEALNRMPASGRTALYDALAAAIEHTNHGRHERKVLLVISDGADNESRQSLDEILTLVEQSDVTIYAVGLFDPWRRDHNRKVLRKLATVSGGRAFFPDSLLQLASTCGSIAAEIRSRYVVGYVPEQVRDGEYRSVEVRVRGIGRKVQVRARPGFRVPRRR